ncbi:MAG: isopentenyl-diphosphate Delta-isomerase [Lachnospiraceae bacterium]
MERKLIAVTMQDEDLYELTKQEAHEKGILHRAFSVLLYNGDKMLIQQRAWSKYHCGGLWSNACCSHPMPGEAVSEAAVRRLREELDIEGVELKELYSFVYYYAFQNGLKEYEYDHVFAGEYYGEIKLDEDEVADSRWISMEDLQVEMQEYPEKFTPWFIQIVGRIVKQ